MKESFVKTSMKNLDHKKEWQKPRFWAILTKKTQNSDHYGDDSFKPFNSS
jgi:hypothetical protein